MLALYSHFDDAWEEDLKGWLTAASQASFQGVQSWMVCHSFVQANYLKRRSLAERLSLFGIHFLDLRKLRQELCQRMGLPSPAFGRETLLLLLKSYLSESAADSVLADQILDGLDELASSGWLAREGEERAFQLLRVPEKLRKPLAILISSPYWRPSVDRLLRESELKLPKTQIAFFGLDTEGVSQTDLLIAAARVCDSVYFWFPQPFRAESLYQKWLTWLESELQTTFKVCAASDSPRPFEPLTGELIYQTRQEVQTPDLVVATRWTDQIECVAGLVTDALAKGLQSVAVVVPDESASGPAIVQSLIEKGVSVSDEYRFNCQPDLPVFIQRWLTEWIERNSPEQLLEFAAFMLTSGFGDFRALLLRRFNDLQTRSVNQLLERAHSYSWANDLIRLGVDWPDHALWSDYVERWNRALEAFHRIVQESGGALRVTMFSIELLQPNWEEIKRYLHGVTVSSKLFLRFLRDSFSTLLKKGNPKAAHRYAPVIVTTPRKLQSSTWDRIILVDAVASKWKPDREDESLLPDSFRDQEVEQHGTLLLSRKERVKIREDQILRLMLHARDSAFVTYYQQEENGDEVISNDWVTLLQGTFEACTYRYEAVRTEVYERIDPVGTAREHRLSPQSPFDEYHFNFESVKMEPQPWQASALQRVWSAPASAAFWFELDAERSWDRNFHRSERAAIGRLVHRTIAQIFGLTEDLFTWREIRPELRDPEAIKQAIERELGVCRKQNDIWWQSIYHVSVCYTEILLNHLTSIMGPYTWFDSESRTSGNVQHDKAKLRLVGRYDLVLSDRAGWENAQLAIVDFKTFGAPAKLDVKTGEGLQLVGYQLLAEAQGAAQVKIIVISPERSRDLEENVAEMAELLDNLSKMQVRGCYGQRESGNYGITEVLPIATLPIPSEVLRSKWEKTFLKR
jgi:hypothetical protein